MNVWFISFQFWAQKNKNLQDMKKVLNEQYKHNLMNYTIMQMQLTCKGCFMTLERTGMGWD